jgi:MoxR-like ATPase
VFVSRAVEQYVVNMAQATRRDQEVRLGVSPRATLHLVRAAKVAAALQGRDFVLPDDIDALVIPVLGHRIVPTRKSVSDHRSGVEAIEEILTRIVQATPVPLVAARSL